MQRSCSFLLSVGKVNLSPVHFKFTAWLLVSLHPSVASTQVHSFKDTDPLQWHWTPSFDNLFYFLRQPSLIPGLILPPRAHSCLLACCSWHRIQTSPNLSAGPSTEEQKHQKASRGSVDTCISEASLSFSGWGSSRRPRDAPTWGAQPLIPVPPHPLIPQVSCSPATGGTNKCDLHPWGDSPTSLTLKSFCSSMISEAFWIPSRVSEPASSWVAFGGNARAGTHLEFRPTEVPQVEGLDPCFPPNMGFYTRKPAERKRIWVLI